jgi:hypothetical protein
VTDKDTITRLEAELISKDADLEAAENEAFVAKSGNAALRAERDALIEALREILKCEGAYKIDPLEFAHAVIENLTSIAEKALAPESKP